MGKPQSTSNLFGNSRPCLRPMPNIEIRVFPRLKERSNSTYLLVLSCFFHSTAILHVIFVFSSLKKNIGLLLDGHDKVKILLPLCGKSVDLKWFAHHFAMICLSFVHHCSSTLACVQHNCCNCNETHSHWNASRLYEEGHEVVGVEYSEAAICQFFVEQQLPFEQLTHTFPSSEHSCMHTVKLFTTSDRRLRIYCMDFFLFSK